MKIIGFVALVVALALSAGMAAQAQEISIAVSPNVFNLDSQGTWVTVHADIPYSSVSGASVTLNGIPVEATFADDCGDLVAKFDLNTVKAILSLGAFELRLTGLTKDGGTFSGTDTVVVIQPPAKSKS